MGSTSTAATLDDMLDGFGDLDFGEPEQEEKIDNKLGEAINIKQPLKSSVETNKLVVSGQKKLVEIGKELNEMFVEREVVIKDALRALVTGQSMLLLGPPGTGKSLLTNELCNRIEQADFFSWLLNRTSDPSEILGPYSIKEMENDKFIRKTDGKLPQAEIVFLDEIFKSNEPTLNILLPLINEKVFFNDGKPVDVPLISLFAASNETPEDESLDALYDRLLFRHWVDYVADPANKQKMYEGYINKRQGNGFKQKASITLEELQAMQEKCDHVDVSKGMLKNFIKLMNVLSRKGIIVSDRRQNECLKIMQGNAVIEGRDKVVLDDLSALVYVLWEKPEDINEIDAEITKIVNPYDNKINDLMRKFKEIQDNLDSVTDTNEKCRLSIEAKGNLESIATRMDKVIKDANKNGKDVTDMNTKRAEIVNYNQKVMQEALGINLNFGD